MWKRVKKAVWRMFHHHTLVVWDIVTVMHNESIGREAAFTAEHAKRNFLKYNKDVCPNSILAIRE